jgi:hypothetical protein
MKHATFALLFFAASPAWAEATTSTTALTGATGTILDAKTKEPLIEATIKVVRGGEGSALTDLDGRYVLELPPGTYELRAYYELYRPRRVTEVVIREGELTPIEIELETDAETVEEVVVEARADTRKEAAVLQERRRAAAVSDAISAQEISRTPDSGANEAVKRVVAATVVDGRYVLVRGLGGRYGSTLLNGVTLPSPDPDEQAVPLDLFPSSLLANLTIAKTYEAHLPGTFGGGALLLETNSYPSQRELRVKLGTGFDSASTFKSRLASPGGGLTFLGLDDGGSSLPDLVPDDQPLSDRAPGRLSATEVEAISESFANRWEAARSTARPGLSLGASLGDTLSLGSKRFGYLASLSLGSKTTVRSSEVGRASLEGGEVRYDQPLVPSEVGTESAVLGGLVNASLELGPRDELSLFSLYTRASDHSAQEVSGYNRNANQVLRTQHLEIVTRSLLFAQLGGRHRFDDLSKLEARWQANGSITQRSQPDTREITYADLGSGTYRFQQESAERFFSELEDHGYGGGLALALPLEGVKLEIGGSLQGSDRTFDARRFVMKLTGSMDAELLSHSPEELFSEENIAPGRFLLREQTKSADAYEAQLLVSAGYASVDLSALEPLRVSAGLRYEVAAQTVDAGSRFSTDNNKVPSVDRTDASAIPSVNVAYAIDSAMNLRAGYSYTVARPTFRELAAFSYYDFVRRRSISGNPSLLETRIHAADLRWERFIGDEGVLAATVFGKRFEDPIERIIANESNQDLTFRNALAATAIGLELEARMGLGFIEEALESFKLGANLGLISSEIAFDPELRSSQTSQKRPLQGQSPYVVNLGLTWAPRDLGTSATILFNVYGRRIKDVGSGGLPDVYELPFHKLDVTIAQDLGAGFSLKLAGQNLLNQTVVERQGPLTIFRYRPGVAGTATLEWSPDFERKD